MPFQVGFLSLLTIVNEGSSLTIANEIINFITNVFKNDRFNNDHFDKTNFLKT